MLLVLAACSSHRFSYSSITMAGRVAELTVDGARPRIEVENQGPGSLRVELFTSDDTLVFDRTLLPNSATTEMAPGPITLRLTTTDETPCEWRVEVWGSSGLQVDLNVAAPPADQPQGSQNPRP